jgi:N-acetylneuraminate synthase/sialic acid synthase
VLPAEESAMLKMGKKLVAARDLPAGHVLTAADIAIKSPGDGLPPYHFAQFLGRPLRKGLKFEDPLDFDLVDERP